jgi:hypothetical protein
MCFRQFASLGPLPGARASRPISAAEILALAVTPNPEAIFAKGFPEVEI